MQHFLVRRLSCYWYFASGHDELESRIVSNLLSSYARVHTDQAHHALISEIKDCQRSDYQLWPPVNAPRLSSIRPPCQAHKVDSWNEYAPCMCGCVENGASGPARPRNTCRTWPAQYGFVVVTNGGKVAVSALIYLEAAREEDVTVSTHEHHQYFMEGENRLGDQIGVIARGRCKGIQKRVHPAARPCYHSKVWRMCQLCETGSGKRYQRVGPNEKRFAVAKCVRDCGGHDMPSGNATIVKFVFALEKDQWVRACAQFGFIIVTHGICYLWGLRCVLPQRKLLYGAPVLVLHTSHVIFLIVGSRNELLHIISKTGLA